MSQTHTLELPEALYNALTQAAQQEGTTALDWIAASLAQPRPAARTPRPEPTQQEIDDANARLRATISTYDSPPDADNEHIDAELAREYGDDHADLYRQEEAA